MPCNFVNVALAWKTKVCYILFFCRFNKGEETTPYLQIYIFILKICILLDLISLKILSSAILFHNYSVKKY